MRTCVSSLKRCFCYSVFSDNPSYLLYMFPIQSHSVTWCACITKLTLTCIFAKEWAAVRHLHVDMKWHGSPDPVVLGR